MSRQYEWRETADARSLTIVIPSDVEISKDKIESVVTEAIEDSKGVEESNDSVQEYPRGYKC